MLVRPRTVQASASLESLFAGSFPAAGGGGTQNLTGSADSAKYTMGTCIQPQVPGTVQEVRWFVPTVNQPGNGDFAVGLYLADPVNGVPGAGTTLLTWQTATAPGAGAAGTWVAFTLSSPQAASTGDLLYPFVRTDRYGFAQFVFTSSDVPNASGHLVGKSNLLVRPNGAFQDTSPGTNPPPIPAVSNNETYYGVDIGFQAS